MHGYDCVVVGLGIMGGAVAHQLAVRGRRVLAVDRFDIPHGFGSSHGESRIIREAYFEDPCYVPLVQRAYTLWSELEQGAGASLYLRTGGVMLGRPDSDLVAGGLHSARTHGLQHEVLDAAAVRARFPALRPDADMIGVFEPRAGVLRAEACLDAMLAAARHAGAELRLRSTVQHLSLDGENPQLQIDGQTVRCRRVVLCAGAWASGLLPSLAGRLGVERQVLHWFAPASPREARGGPVHLWQAVDGGYPYGFPDLGAGIKLARHHGGLACSADTVDRTVHQAEIDAMHQWAARYLPDAVGAYLRSTVCLYTNTADGHFLLAPAPEHPGVWVVSACSGHGFKFAPVIGELMAQWVCDQPLSFDLARFGWR
ncbi:MAG: N-methyl-L-tryptophan oxidase [Xanthomonadales bacterium]|nr:N-methyl-L-tryptophan oxidase [Xanthomonadales bacterium]